MLMTPHARALLRTYRQLKRLRGAILARILTREHIARLRAP